MDWDISTPSTRRLACLLVMGAAAAVRAQAGGLLTKYGCEGELVRLSCDSARVIRIVRANYGRLGPAVCPPRPPAPPTSECLHRATKTVLDRACGGRGSCAVRASAASFPGAEAGCGHKYLEVHWRCEAAATGGGGAGGGALPPWLADLHATYRPAAPSTPASPSSSSAAPPRNSSRPEAAGTSSQGRYFLLPEAAEGGDTEPDPGLATLAVSVTISIVSTLLSILIIFHICRRLRSKPPPPPACYQCGPEGHYELAAAKAASASVAAIPVQSLLYSPAPAPEAVTPAPGGGDTNAIYRIPEDYIDSNNYMRHSNILHTELYSDRGDIKIVSGSQSLHPVCPAPAPALAAVTPAAQMQSLPDLSSGSLGLARQQPGAEAVTRLQEPIQILFNDSGQYFVNFSLDQSR